MILSIGAFLIIYILLNYYIGVKGLDLLGIYNIEPNKVLYWTIFYFIVFSYILGKILRKYISKSIIKILDYLGSYWMAIMLYSFLVILVVDIIREINGRLQIISINNSVKLILGSLILVGLLFILIYGTFNGRNTVVNKYELNIEKKAGNLKSINILMASDIHIGSSGYKNRMEKLVELTESIKPDVVLLVGDIIDDSVEPFIDRDMGQYFKKIKTPLGVYGVTGNHEYISRRADEFVEILKESKVIVLQDEYIKIKDSFYIIGRNDIGCEGYYGKKRKTLKDITSDMDKNMPIILMDHQPRNLNEALEEGVDLQLSGHTHKGQLSPSNIITNKIFEIDWGYLKKKSLNIIVSSGFGTWGPPMRIGSRSELVNIVLNFK